MDRRLGDKCKLGLCWLALRYGRVGAMFFVPVCWQVCQACETGHVHLGKAIQKSFLSFKYRDGIFLPCRTATTMYTSKED